MIAFACAVASAETFRCYASPGIEFAAEPDSRVLERHGYASIFRAYNDVLEEVGLWSDLEAVVFVHQDLQIVDPEFVPKVRRRMLDPSVAVIGVLGANGVRSMAWWEGDEVMGSWKWSSDEGDVNPLHWSNFRAESQSGAHEVDCVDGMLIVLSPWAARELRFDEDLSPGFHGYDVDICFQARARGRRVMIDELKAVHHHPRKVLADRDAWIRAHKAFGRKWEAWIEGAPSAQVAIAQRDRVNPWRRIYPTSAARSS